MTSEASYQADHKAAWLDLRERLIRASGSLQELANSVGLQEGAKRARLLDKRSGVDLALSYMDEWERTGFTLVTKDCP